MIQLILILGLTGVTTWLLVEALMPSEAMWELPTVNVTEATEHDLCSNLAHRLDSGVTHATVTIASGPSADNTGVTWAPVMTVAQKMFHGVQFLEAATLLSCPRCEHDGDVVFVNEKDWLITCSSRLDVPVGEIRFKLVYKTHCSVGLRPKPNMATFWDPSITKPVEHYYEILSSKNTADSKFVLPRSSVVRHDILPNRAPGVLARFNWVPRSLRFPVVHSPVNFQGVSIIPFESLGLKLPKTSRSNEKFVVELKAPLPTLNDTIRWLLTERPEGAFFRPLLSGAAGHDSGYALIRNRLVENEKYFDAFPPIGLPNIAGQGFKITSDRISLVDKFAEPCVLFTLWVIRALAFNPSKFLRCPEGFTPSYEWVVFDCCSGYVNEDVTGANVGVQNRDERAQRMSRSAAAGHGRQMAFVTADNDDFIAGWMMHPVFICEPFIAAKKHGHCTATTTSIGVVKHPWVKPFNEHYISWPARLDKECNLADRPNGSIYEYIVIPKGSTALSTTALVVYTEKALVVNPENPTLNPCGHPADSSLSSTCLGCAKYDEFYPGWFDHHNQLDDRVSFPIPDSAQMNVLHLLAGRYADDEALTVWANEAIGPSWSLDDVEASAGYKEADAAMLAQLRAEHKSTDATTVGLATHNAKVAALQLQIAEAKAAACLRDHERHRPEDLLENHKCAECRLLHFPPVCTHKPEDFADEPLEDKLKMAAILAVLAPVKPLFTKPVMEESIGTYGSWKLTVDVCCDKPSVMLTPFSGRDFVVNPFGKGFTWKWIRERRFVTHASIKSCKCDDWADTSNEPWLWPLKEPLPQRVYEPLPGREFNTGQMPGHMTMPSISLELYRHLLPTIIALEFGAIYTYGPSDFYFETRVRMEKKCQTGGTSLVAPASCGLNWAGDFSDFAGTLLYANESLISPKDMNEFARLIDKKPKYILAFTHKRLHKFPARIPGYHVPIHGLDALQIATNRITLSGWFQMHFWERDGIVAPDAVKTAQWQSSEVRQTVNGRAMRRLVSPTMTNWVAYEIPDRTDVDENPGPKLAWAIALFGRMSQMRGHKISGESLACATRTYAHITGDTFEAASARLEKHKDHNMVTGVDLASELWARGHDTWIISVNDPNSSVMNIVPEPTSVVLFDRAHFDVVVLDGPDLLREYRNIHHDAYWFANSTRHPSDELCFTGCTVHLPVEGVIPRVAYASTSENAPGILFALADAKALVAKHPDTLRQVDVGEASFIEVDKTLDADREFGTGCTIEVQGLIYLRVDATEYATK